MVENVVEVKNKTGLHARPASQFVKKANLFKSKITIAIGEREANGKSIMGVLSLSIKQFTRIVIKTEGEDEREALEDLSNFIIMLEEN